MPPGWAAASLLSVWVKGRERELSRELPLAREPVRERAKRVILAEGTGRRRRGSREEKRMTNRERGRRRRGEQEERRSKVEQGRRRG